jgi:hypothetical protein
MLHVIPRLRSPKDPFSFRYWLSRLHFCEKLGFSGALACLCPEKSANPAELDIFNWMRK